MAHAWKACWVQALGGSNPPSSANAIPVSPRDRDSSETSWHSLWHSYRSLSAFTRPVPGLAWDCAIDGHSVSSTEPVPSATTARGARLHDHRCASVPRGATRERNGADHKPEFSGLVDRDKLGAVADISVRSSDSALDALPGQPISSDICSAEPTGRPRRSSFTRRGAKSMGSLIAGTTTMAGRTRPPAGHLRTRCRARCERWIVRFDRESGGVLPSGPETGLVATPPHPTPSRRS